jgi:hypothetical protein
VQYGTQVQTLAAKYHNELGTLAAIDPGTVATLSVQPTNTSAAATAIGEIAKAFQVDAGTATQRLLAVAAVPRADLAFLQAHATEVQQASLSTPGQWQSWWWVCVGGEAVFIPLIFLMGGRWSPKRARDDLAEHEAAVAKELAELAKT